LKPKMIQSEVEIQMEDKKTADIIWNAIKPEIENSPSNRSKMEMKLKDKTIILKIKSKDATAFRAAINSTLRWIKLAYDIKNLKR